MSFMDNLGYMVGGAVDGYSKGMDIQEKRQKLLDEEDARQGQALTGQILQGLGGVQPQQQQPSILDQVKSMFAGGQQPGMVPQGMDQGAPLPPGYGQPQQPSPPPSMGRMPTPAPMPQQAPAMAPQGPPQQAPQGGPPQQAGGVPGGRLDWRQIVQMAKQANPNASPQAIALAVSNFMPLMSQQAQEEWRQVQLQVLQENAATRRANEKDQAFYRRDTVQQRRDAAKQASDDKAAARAQKAQDDAEKADQKAQELKSKEFERVSTAYTKLANAIAGNSKLDTQANRDLLQKLQDKMTKLGDSTGASPDAQGGAPAAAKPPVDGAKRAPDGNWYIPDPTRKGKWLQVVPNDNGG